MDRQLELYRGVKLACPRCGSDDLRVVRLYVHDPRDQLIEFTTDPLALSDTDGGNEGANPFVTLVSECGDCALNNGDPAYLIMNLDPAGYTRARRNWDDPDEGGL